MTSASSLTPMALPLITGKTRAYFAPVNRTLGVPTIFDPALHNGWTGITPPSPWLDLGWVSDLKRTDESVLGEVYAGAPGVLRTQTKQRLGESVAFRFEMWSKLSMALSANSQHMNVLAAATGASVAVGSGASAARAVALTAASTSMKLYLAGTGAVAPQAGALVVVDVDYSGQTGFVGSGASGGYVTNASALGDAVNYVRRVSFNVGRVTGVGADGGIALASPLLAGAPTDAMKLQVVSGFVDRGGGSFFPEWSALFVRQGMQGERLCLHYPRLQSLHTGQEQLTTLGAPLELVELAASFRAMPIADINDGEQVVCYRSYQPARVAYV